MRQSAAITDEARRRADQTAGEALAAVADAKRIEQTANAMRNVIEGYGDRYVIPAAGLLDELAEEFASPRPDNSSRPRAIACAR